MVFRGRAMGAGSSAGGRTSWPALSNPGEVTMGSTPMSSEHATQSSSAERLDTKLEVVVVPVSDVDRAKAFYGRLGWRLDGDFTSGEDWRGVQMTPPGS